MELPLMKNRLQMMGLSFSTKWEWCSCFVSITKTASNKLEIWFILCSFFPQFLATLISWINYRKRYVGLLVQPLLFLLNLWPIFDMCLPTIFFKLVLLLKMFIWTSWIGFSSLFSYNFPVTITRSFKDINAKISMALILGLIDTFHLWAFFNQISYMLSFFVFILFL